MGQFFKFVFASCLGTLLAFGGIILMFIVIGALQSDVPNVKSNSFLKLEFDHLVTELTDNVETSFSDTQRAIGVHDITRLINEAKSDAKISGIVIDAPQVSMGPSTANLIREALLDFKDTDKPIYAYGDFFGQSGYYLSSAADSIFLNPNGSIEIKGFGAVIPFYKSLMDEIGVHMNIFYRGRYKSATEPFRRNEMSEENREQYGRYLEYLKKNYFEEIAASRNTTYEAIDDLANSTLVVTPELSIEQNLVDSILYENDFEKLLKSRSGVKQSRLMRYTSLEDYLAVYPDNDSSGSKDEIAIVYAEGGVAYDTDDNGTISEVKYGKIFNRIIKNDDIKAVVFRVNSPGGASISSDIIWDYIGKVKAAGKYVAVSMGDYAASGGYYIACNADTIFADKNTLTGSIGIYLMYPEFSKLAKEKLGIGIDSITTNKYTGTNSFLLALNEDEKQKMQAYTDYLYKQFLTRVAEGRDMSVEEVHNIAEGRIWTSEDALDNKLIDEIGNLQATIDAVAGRLNLEEYSTNSYPKITKDFMRELIENLSQNVDLGQNKSSEASKVLNHIIKKLNVNKDYKQPMAQMPDIQWL